MSKKQILIVTNYFPPEKGAAANRIAAMANGFKHNGYRVEIVCPFPNYPEGEIFEGFKNKLYHQSKTKSTIIHRLWLWPSNSKNKFVRLISMLSFSFSLLLFFLLKKTPKLILIQYSPVFVGFTGVTLSRILSKKVILNVSDLWPLAGLEMGLLRKGTYYSLLEWMEHFCYRKSTLVLGQSQEIIDYVRTKVPDVTTFLYRNYPDFTPPTLEDKIYKSRIIKVVYAGLLGVAQGVLDICEKINLPSHIELHIYGAGPEESQIKRLERNNIRFCGMIERAKLHEMLVHYNIALVPLKQRVYGSVPSKIFEYTKLGLPILYYAGGEGEQLIEDYELGWVIEAGNFANLQEFITCLHVDQLRDRSRLNVQQKAVANFNFDRQLDLLLKQIEGI